MDFSDGGEEGIRTLDALLTHTPLAGERLRPLGHLSTCGDSEGARVFQALSIRIVNSKCLASDWPLNPKIFGMAFS